MNKIDIPIRGMHCASCEILIGESLKKVPGVSDARVSNKKSKAEIYFNSQTPPDAEALLKAVQDAGYNVGVKGKQPWLSKNILDYKDLARAAGILLIIYLLARWFNIFDFSVSTANTGVVVALFVGLVAGISTCMALVGGLLLSLSARHAELHPEATALQKFRPHLYFNFGRILGYSFFGGMIGLAGQVFKPSNNLLGFLTIIIGGVMIFFGLKLIEIFPVLKDKSITLPSSVARLFGLHKEVKEYSRKSAMVMGGLTFFLPCGFTQAMQLYAVSTGSFWQGMAIMGLFALGTAPGLLGIGGLTSVFKGRKARIFFMAAGLAVIIVGWTNIVNGSHLFSGVAKAANAKVYNGEARELRMIQDARGYSPNVFTIKKGKPVKWIINSTAISCASYLIMPKYGISQSLRSGENIITFTPTEVGEIPFSCSMGMYRGKFIVVEDDGANTPVAASTQTLGQTSGGCGSGGSGCGGGGGCGGKQPSSPPTPGAVKIIDTPQGPTQLIQTTYTIDKDILPNVFTVKRGQPVRFEIKPKESGSGCMGNILVAGLHNQPEYLQEGKTIVMEFTAPTAGDYPITCAMGIARGVIKVVE